MTQEGLKSVFESNEAPKSPSYEIHIDRGAIAGQEGIPESMKEWLTHLPENLVFKEPITLIIGENGSGKTIFSKAITCARTGSFGANNSETKFDPLLLNEEDPALVLADAFSVSEADVDDGGTRAIYLDGVEVMAETRRWAKEETHRNSRIEDSTGGAYTHRLSTRQLFEQTIQDIKKRTIDFNRRDFARAHLVFDEPEQGLSPLRQLDLLENLSRFIENGDNMLVPTNNLALYLSDLPRIDISQPERGIFRPSDFGEEGKIVLHGRRD